MKTLIELLKEHKLLDEGVYDPGIFKCFFMCGGPGSGKSYIARELFGLSKNAFGFLSSSGLKIINSDPVFEEMLKRAGYDLDLDKLSDEEYYALTSDDPSSMRSKAKDLINRMSNLYVKNRLGIIIDGTASNYEKIENQKEMMESMGYDCYMIFVNTTLDMAQERNSKRKRRLKKYVVIDLWHKSNDNIGKFQELFGQKDFIIVDNTENKSVSINIVKLIARFLRDSVKNPIGKRWISSELEKKKR